jgi:hypothetical protein
MDKCPKCGQDLTFLPLVIICGMCDYAVEQRVRRTFPSGQVVTL